MSTQGRTGYRRRARHRTQRSTQMAERQAVKRISHPSDVANAVAWLASDEAAYVSAQTLVVDADSCACNGSFDRCYPNFRIRWALPEEIFLRSMSLIDALVIAFAASRLSENG